MNCAECGVEFPVNKRARARKPKVCSPKCRKVRRTRQLKIQNARHKRNMVYREVDHSGRNFPIGIVQVPVRGWGC